VNSKRQQKKSLLSATNGASKLIKARPATPSSLQQAGEKITSAHTR